jgi:hypothetical protein
MDTRRSIPEAPGAAQAARVPILPPNRRLPRRPIARPAGGALKRQAKNPKPVEILAARRAFGLTQQAAADLALSKKRTWAGWEAGETKMHPAIWRWFLHQTADLAPIA